MKTIDPLHLEALYEALKLGDEAIRPPQPFARSHVDFNGEAAVNGLDVIPHWLTAKEELEVLPSPSRRRWRAIFARATG